MKSYYLAVLAVLVAPAAAPAQETTSFEYDAQGRLTKSAKVGGPNDGKEKCTTYDPKGNRTEHEVTNSSCTGGDAPASPGGGGGPSGPLANDDAIAAECGIGSVNVLGNDSGAGNTATSVTGGMGAFISGGSTVTVTSAINGGTLKYTITDANNATASANIAVANSCVN